MAPCAGGLKVEFEQKSIMLVTFDSPLGGAIRGKSVGDEVSYRVGATEHWYEIETIL
jgi:transcription elongation GreA/GreB family factor